MERLFGAAARVAEGLGNMIKLELRHTVLGHIQRGGSPSAFDRILGTRFGEAAVHLIAQGKFGQMVALRGRDVISVPMSEAVDQQKLVDFQRPHGGGCAQPRHRVRRRGVAAQPIDDAAQIVSFLMRKPGVRRLVCTPTHPLAKCRP